MVLFFAVLQMNQELRDSSSEAKSTKRITKELQGFKRIQNKSIQLKDSNRIQKIAKDSEKIQKILRIQKFQKLGNHF